MGAVRKTRSSPESVAGPAMRRKKQPVRAAGQQLRLGIEGMAELIAPLPHLRAERGGPDAPGLVPSPLPSTRVDEAESFTTDTLTPRPRASLGEVRSTLWSRMLFADAR